MVLTIVNGEVVGHTATAEMLALDREGPYSWTEGNQRDLAHQELIATGGFSEVHKVYAFQHNGTLKRLDQKYEDWKGAL
jgi:hypothetical protein